MKIVIIGAGAMGCLYGSKLSASGKNEVYLLDVWQAHIDAMNKEGLHMEENGNELVYDKVKGATDPSSIGPCDLAVVFVKSTLTEDALKKNKAVFGENTVALTLQNGLGNIEAIGSVIGEKNVIAGTTAHGATMLGPGKMRHAGAGKTVIGELDGAHTERIGKIADVLEEAGFETEISENVLGLVWDKLMANVGINALTAICEVPNGDLVKSPYLEELLAGAVAEAAEVAKAKGITLPSADPVAHAKDVAKNTGGNKSSMYQDILNKRITEINMINGAIVREGKAVGVPTPINQILTNLILWKQSAER